jgi:hypothetical protein
MSVCPWCGGKLPDDEIPDRPADYCPEHTPDEATVTL